MSLQAPGNCGGPVICDVHDIIGKPPSYFEMKSFQLLGSPPVASSPELCLVSHRILFWDKITHSVVDKIGARGRVELQSQEPAGGRAETW